MAKFKVCLKVAPWPILGKQLDILAKFYKISTLILTFDHTKIISSSRRIECCKEFVRYRYFGYFLLQGLTWATLGAWTQNRPQNVGTYPDHHLQLIARNLVFEIFRGELPPSPLNGIKKFQSKKLIFRIYTGHTHFTCVLKMAKI